MATIKDVARVAGVSVTTVSRALNHYSDVNFETKKKIFEVAKELNYVPNKAAQNLVKRENKTLAFILSGLEKEGGKDNIIYRLLSGMYEYAATIDYDVALYTTDSAHQKKKGYVEFCREHNISGAIMNGIRMDDPYLKEIIESKMPCVLIDVDLAEDNVSCIMIDNEHAAFEAVQLLVNNNHTNIAMVTGRQEADVSIKRQNGYKKALAVNKIDYRQEWVVCGDFLEEQAYQEAKKLFSQHSEITAVFCASDMMALGTMKAIRELGLRIPEDISVIGFDDIPLVGYLSPALATVHQDFHLMGYYAGKQLVQMIHHEKCEKKIFIEHKILARDTIRML